jgi:putrescine aminotransferase
LVEKVRDDIGPYFRRSLQQLADDHPIVGELRGVGLIAALQLVKDKATRTIFPEHEPASVLCRDYALQNSLIMRPAGLQTLVLSPPLIISRAEVDELVDKVKRSMDMTAKHFDLL